ncbi:methyl-accepting chemotaxis protein [Halostella sp. JP-L12]|uniref:methyl-accepting chemotaxis protein n=1 Tax=Halostella TaxID=1843185 RepID=UPI000EF7A9AA|nr:MULTISPECIES: methyl-accepting chemotaxis protein [Halostella]NHN47822.1 methyl-accepting chemotaxis protein [Halostella sp. JP-L12]
MSKRGRETGDGDDGIGTRLRVLVPGIVQRRYAAKFVASMLVVVLVISAVGAINYVEARDTVEADAQTQLRSTAHLQSDAVSEWIRNMRGQTQALSCADALRDGDAEAVRERLERRTESSGPVKAVHYVDTANDTVAASTAPSLEGESLSAVAMPWTELAPNGSDEVRMTDSSYWSPVLHDHEVVAFASSVPERDRMVVVVGGFYHRLDDLHQPKSTQMTWIVDTEGETVLTSNNSDAEAPGDTRAHVRALLDEGDRDREHRHGNMSLRETSTHLLAYARIRGTDWVAIAAVDKDRAYAVRDGVAKSVLTIVAGGLGSLLLVGVVLGCQTIVPLSRLRRKARRMESGDLDVDLGTRRQDEIGRLYAGFASMRDSLQARIRDAETTNRRLEAKADEYSAVMQRCAEGDLTQRMDPDGENEAMAEIAREFNDMIAELEGTAARLSAFAEEVGEASERVTASAEEVSDASEQVGESIGEIADGADRQHDLLRSVTREMDDLSTTIEDVAATSVQVAELAERSAETGREGREAARAAVDGMRRIEAESEETAAEFERLEAEIERIDDLVETMVDVADRTNVLAMNADIEAARADESIEGFAAVARQVDDLAERSREVTRDVESRVTRLQCQTGRTAEAVRETRERVSEHADTVEDAAAALSEIADHAQVTNRGVQRISETTCEQAASIDQAVDLADEAAAVSESATEESATVAAAAERQTTALADVSLSAATLGGRARRLSEMLDDFETDADGGVPDDGPLGGGDGPFDEGPFGGGDEGLLDPDSKDWSFEEMLDPGE